MYTFYHGSSAEENNTPEAGTRRVTVLSVVGLDGVWVYDDEYRMSDRIWDMKGGLYVARRFTTAHRLPSAVVSHTMSAIYYIIL